MGCYNSVRIEAPVERVWEFLRDFHNMDWAPHVVNKIEKIGEKNGTQPGAQRVLNEAIQETLISLNETDHMMRYSIDDGPDAISKNNISGYVGEVHAFAITEDNSTCVVWSSRWDSGGEGVQEFCDPIYQALLGDLKETIQS